MAKDWVVERRINLGDIFTIGSLATAIIVAGVSGWIYINARVDTLAARTGLIEQAIELAGKQYEKDQQVIHSTLARNQSRIEDQMRRDRNELLGEIRSLRSEVKEAMK